MVVRSRPLGSCLAIAPLALQSLWSRVPGTPCWLASSLATYARGSTAASPPRGEPWSDLRIVLRGLLTARLTTDKGRLHFISSWSFFRLKNFILTAIPLSFSVWQWRRYSDNLILKLRQQEKGWIKKTSAMARATWTSALCKN